MLHFFDCDVGVGPSRLTRSVFSGPSELLPILDHYGIRKALVHDRGALESGRLRDVDFLLRFCAESDRLLPTVPIVPPATGEQPPPDELVPFLLARGIKAVRAAPSMHRFRCEPASMGRLLAVLERHRLPVLYDASVEGAHIWDLAPRWQEIRECADAFPGLPIIVLWTGMQEGRNLLPLLEHCPNVLADLSCQTFQFVEYVTRALGSGRLVFASHLPLEDPGLYTTRLAYSMLSAECAHDIAFGNLERLI